MTTHISIMDDGYNLAPSQPVMGVYALYQATPPPSSRLGTVDPEDDEEAKAAKDAIESKVIASPGKAKAAPAPASAEVETK